MKKKDFIILVNEEIEKFDFLGSDESHKDEANIELLNNEDLQKQFICDSLLAKNAKIKIIHVDDSHIGGNWESNELEDVTKLSIEYNISIEYLYDSNEKPIIFDVRFHGDNVSVSADGTSDSGTYDTPPANEAWFSNIDWQAINASLFADGSEIEFTAFERAPINIRKLFVKEYVEQLIVDRTTMDIHDNLNNSIVTQYC